MKKQKKNIIIFSILLIGYFFISKIFKIYIPCIFHEITKLYCPGCGVTRMIFEIAKGNFKQAFYYNQLLFIASPFIAYMIIDYVYSTFKEKTPLYKKIPNNVYIVFLIILIIFAVIRNIFPYFAPINI